MIIPTNQDFRRKSLHLPVIPLKNVYVGPNLVGVLKVPHTYMWSPSLVPKPYDWGDHIGMYGRTNRAFSLMSLLYVDMSAGG
jgi:hypothetical protein